MGPCDLPGEASFPEVAKRFLWKPSAIAIAVLRKALQIITGVDVNDHRLKAVASGYGLKPD